MKAWLDRLLGKSNTMPAPPVPDSDGWLVNAYATVRELPALAFEHQLLSQRAAQDPALAPHLAGFVQHVLGRGNGEMTARRYGLMRHIERVQQQVSLKVDSSAWPAYLQWAQRANAISFLPDASIVDTQGRELLDAAGAEPDPHASLPALPEALDRKARSEAALHARGLRVLPSLPPVLAEAELQPRETVEIAARALATLAAAVRAEALGNQNDLSSEQILSRLPDAQAALSPQEREFMEADAPDHQTIANMGWRYECVAVFAWALGLQEDLPFPDQICDVRTLSHRFLTAGTLAVLLEQSRPRSAKQVLDALDEIYRLHWCITDARIQQQPPPDGVLPGVVVERHRALNWLVRFENADWDDVQMPT